MFSQEKHHDNLLVLLQELFVERAELAEHLLQLGRLGQDRGAEVVRARALPKAGTGDDADACEESESVLLSYFR